MHISTILVVVFVASVKISYGNHIETEMARRRGFGGVGGGGGLRGGGGFQGFGGGIPGRATIPGMPMPGDPTFGRMFGGGGGAIGGGPRRLRGGSQVDLFGGSGFFPGGFPDGALVGGRDGLPMFGGSGQSDPRGAADGRFDGSIGADLSTLFGQGLVPSAIGLGGTFGATDGGFMDPTSGQPVQLVSTGVADQFRQARLGAGGAQFQSSSSTDPFAAFFGADSTSGFSATGIANTGDGLFMGIRREPVMIQPVAQFGPKRAVDTTRMARILAPRRGNGRSFGSGLRTKFLDQMTTEPVQFISTGTFNTNRGTQSQRMVTQGLGLGGIFGAVPDAQFIDPTSGAPVQLAPTGIINTLRDARAGGFAGFGGQGGGVPTLPGVGMGGNIFQQQGIGGFPQGGAGGAGSFTPGATGADQFQPITIRIPADRSRGPTVTRSGFTEQLGPGTTLADLGLGGTFGASAGSFGQGGAGLQGFQSFGQQGLGSQTGGQGGSQIFPSQSFQIPSGSQGFPQGVAGLGTQGSGGFDTAFAGFGAQSQFGGSQPQPGAGFQSQFGAGTASSFGQQAGQTTGQQFGGLPFTQFSGSQASQGSASSGFFPTDFSQFQDFSGGAAGQFQSSLDAPFQSSGASSAGFGTFGEQAGTSLPGVSLTASNPGVGQLTQPSPQGTDLTGFSGLAQSGASQFSQGPSTGGQFGGTSSGGSASTFSGQGGSTRGNLADQTFGGFSATGSASGSGTSAAGPVVRPPTPSGQPDLVVLQMSDLRRENLPSIFSTLSGMSEMGGRGQGSVSGTQ